MPVSRQAHMHGVDISNDISDCCESIQPTDQLVSLLFQDDGSPLKCVCPPLFVTVSLLLLRRAQDLFER